MAHLKDTMEEKFRELLKEVHVVKGVEVENKFKIENLERQVEARREEKVGNFQVEGEGQAYEEVVGQVQFLKEGLEQEKAKREDVINLQKQNNVAQMSLIQDVEKELIRRIKDSRADSLIQHTQK